MLSRIRQMVRAEAGITGLETAIILIAFVVVASVMAYTVLSAGIFSTEAGKEAIYSGLDRVGNSLEISGGALAEDTDADSDVDRIIFSVSNALGGGDVDFKVTTDSDGDRLLSDEASPVHTTVASYLDASNRIDDIAWTKTQIGKGDSDDLLESGETFQLTLNIPTSVTLNEYDEFTIEIVPNQGAALIFERQLPGKIDSIVDLR